MVERNGAVGKFVLSSQPEVAEFFGQDRQTIGAWSSAGMPGERGHWDLKLCFDWAREQGKFGVKGKDEQLEAYRRERTELARLEKEEKLRNLQPIDKLMPAWQQLSSILRNGADTLQRKYGAEAADIYNEMIDACTDVVEKTVQSLKTE